MINKETIQEIFETARIEEVVEEFVSLKKRGVNYIGLCPFHNEKTPSFTVSPSKGIYKCFGCGKGGNAVNFIMEHEQYSYPEALRYLAKKYNIEVEEEEQTPEQLQQLNEQESLFSLNNFALSFFTENLFKTEEGKAIALSYLKDRDLGEETIKKFQLGYSPDKWEALTNKAIENGYKLDYLEKTGLTIIKDDKRYDRFRGRIIFPIHNLTGKVIGFGGRILSKDQAKAKYVNSPESDIYNKSKSLYGIFFSKNAIVKNDNCYLVEGYTDVISLNQSGIENVVASSGTSLTTEQIKLIKRYTRNITILYDGDEAGLKASFRSIDMILEQGMNIKIVMFPENEDPDSFVRKHRTAEVEKFLDENAADFISFKAKLLLEDSKGDPVKKATLVKDIVNTISLVPDGIFRSFYVKECSNIMDVPEQSLMNELNRLLRKRFWEKINKEKENDIPESTEYTSEKQIEVDVVNTEVQEREILRLLLTYGSENIYFDEEDEKKRKKRITVNVAFFIINDIKNDDIKFRDQVYQKIFDLYSEILENNKEFDKSQLLSHQDEEISKAVVDLIATPYDLSDNWTKRRIYVTEEKDILKQAITSTLLSYKSKQVDKMILDNQEDIKKSANEEDRSILLQKHINLKKKSIEINNQLSRIITK